MEITSKDIVRRSGQPGNKNRKYGRNAAYAKRYRAENRLLKNKMARMVRTLRNQPNNKELYKRIKELTL